MRHRLLLLAGVFALCFWILSRVALSPDVPFIDERLLSAIYSHSADWLDSVMRTVTVLGDWLVVLGTGALLTAYCLRRRKSLLTFVVIGTLAASLILNIVLKGLFDRVRPDLWVPLVQETSFSFPSGHATASAALGLLLMYVAWRTRWRLAVTIVAMGYILVIGFSRLYLGVHYPTDILGGWLLAATTITLMVYFSHAGKDLKLV